MSSFSDAIKREPLPFILVIIDNVAGFLQTKAGQKQYDLLQYYLKNSANYGVAYLFTISHVKRDQYEEPGRSWKTEKFAIQLKG